jgi:hypothetical protein
MSFYDESLLISILFVKQNKSSYILDKSILSLFRAFSFVSRRNEPKHENFVDFSA